MNHEAENVLSSPQQQESTQIVDKNQTQKRNTMLLPFDESNLKEYSPWRRNLYKKLTSHTFELWLITLTLIDLMIVMSELILKIHILESDSIEEHDLHKYELAEKILSSVSFCILSFFAIEMILLIVAIGFQFFFTFLYVLDLTVIAVSIFFEFYDNQEAVGLVIAGRLWRIIKVFHALVTTFEIERSLIFQRIEIIVKKIAQNEINVEKGGKFEFDNNRLEFWERIEREVQYEDNEKKMLKFLEKNFKVEAHSTQKYQNSGLLLGSEEQN